MNISRLVFPTSVIALLLAGCQSTPSAQGYAPPTPLIPQLSSEEAFRFENGIKAQTRETFPKPKELFVQPGNKKEGCKIRTTDAQLASPNFKAFWDGQCKDGFAFGLGRDISISDVHHVEEITTYGANGDNWGSPLIDYDFVNKVAMYTVPTGPMPASHQYKETYLSELGNFNVRYEIGQFDSNANYTGKQWRAFAPSSIVVKNEGLVRYRYTDLSLDYSNLDNAVLTAEVMDSKRDFTGLGIARYRNGVIRHFKFDEVTKAPQVIMLPQSYVDVITSKVPEINAALAQTGAEIEKAKAMERQYLYKACSAKISVTGLTLAKYEEICNWRDQFKAEYDSAKVAYAAKLDKNKADGEKLLRDIQAQRIVQMQAQQQLNLQQQAFNQQQAQQTQQSIQESLNALNNTAAQMRNSAINSMAVPMPSVVPISMPGSNQIRCISAGVYTNCRY